MCVYTCFCVGGTQINMCGQSLCNAHVGFHTLSRFDRVPRFPEVIKDDGKAGRGGGRMRDWERCATSGGEKERIFTPCHVWWIWVPSKESKE